MATLHNPVNFEPRDYIVEDYLDNQRPQYCGQPIEVLEREIRAWEVEMQRIFGDGWISKIHRCIHCGNGNVRWITAVRHVPSGDVVTFGSDCTKRLGFADKMAFKLAQLQARAEARKVRFTIFHERQAFLAAHPAIVEAIACIDEPAHASNSFVKDVLVKLDQYGSLSERQVAAVAESLQRDIARAARKAAEAAAPQDDAPSGRCEVSGTVLSIKEHESDWGSSYKMLIKIDGQNARAWMTVPSGNIERGDHVIVRATFEISKDDRSFAFGKRPILINRASARQEETSEQGE